MAKQAIDTLSLTYERRGIKIVPWLWEDSAPSEIGPEIQATIDAQLGSYDIYIGIMGARFGTPTSTCGSGTEEEFNTALASNRSSGKPRIGFFFQEVTIKTTSLTPDSLGQLNSVIAFRQKVGGLGLFREFSENHVLANLVTTTVSSFIDEDNPHLGTIAIQLDMGLATTSPGLSVSRTFVAETLNSFDDNIAVGAEPLTLEAVWIEPDFRNLSGSDEGKSGRNTVSLDDEVAQFDTGGAGLLISGSETSGKSAVCRRLFQMLAASGHIPVLVSADRINNPDILRFSRRLRIMLAEQYENTRDIPDHVLKEKCVVIIDDWNLIKVSRNQSPAFLTEIRNAYHGVILTVPSGYEFQWLESIKEAVPLVTFRRIEIADLGSRKRYELIERWCQLRNEETDPESYRELVETRRKTVNRVLGSNLVPRTAFMVLILLQAIDAGKESDLTKSGYIRYYKFLIDNTILRNSSPRDAEGAYALLPELAWEIYLTESKVLSAAAAENVIEKFAERKALPKGFLYSVLGSLHTIGMFESINNTHKFRQLYSYYYFLAEYISANLPSKTMQALVIELCRNVSTKENAVLLAFLSYRHETMPLIAKTLLNELKTLYVSTEPFTFSDRQVVAVNALISELPQAIFDEERTSERRLDRIDNEDRDERSSEAAKPSGEEPASSMIKALTSVEILGHILRNHYARLDAKPKLDILDGSSSAILRSLGDIFDLLAKSSEALGYLLSVVSDGVDDNSKREEKIKRAKRSVFHLAVILVYYFVRQLARAMGDESLEVTFSQALANNESSAAHRFINVFLKLESFRAFPLAEVRDLAAEFKTNRIAMAALRVAVAERLDMQPPSPRDLQKICDAVQLSLKPRIMAGRLR